MRLAVLTFNTWGAKSYKDERWPIIGKGIAELSTDLVGLQEIFTSDQVYQLQKITGIQAMCFMDNQSGLAVLSRYPLENFKVHRYLTTSPSEPYFRFCQSCLVFPLTLTSSPRILFVVTHLSWKPEDAAVRESQVMELLHFIEGDSIGQTCILVGDFNAAPDSKEMGLILNAGFVDTFGSLHPNDPGFTWSHSNPYTATHPELPERRIDHIFVRTPRGSTVMIDSSEIVLNEPTAEGVYPSDHFGVLTGLILPD